MAPFILGMPGIAFRTVPPIGGRGTGTFLLLFIGTEIIPVVINITSFATAARGIDIIVNNNNNNNNE